MNSECTDSESETNTENYDNPRRDILAEGFLRLLKPVVDDLEEKVKSTRIAQYELTQQLRRTLSECYQISRKDPDNKEIEVYVSKLVNIKHRVTVILNILQNSQDRLVILHNQIENKQRHLDLQGLR